MSLEDLVHSYGYAAVLVGTFLEGETILVIGGYMAHLGYLDLRWVIVCAILGACTSDQLFYLLGRYKGQKLLDRRPRWRQRTGKILDLLHRHHLPVILGFRFLYGLRNITPFAIGTTGIRPLRFGILNLLGGIVWAITLASAGYLFGYTLQAILRDARRYEMLGLSVMAAIGLALWVRHVFRRRPAPGAGNTEIGAGPGQGR